MLDARATGDPGLLGTMDVDLRDLGLQANQPAEAFWLPLKVLPYRLFTAWCTEWHSGQDDRWNGGACTDHSRGLYSSRQHGDDGILQVQGSQQGAVQLAVQLLMKDKPPPPGPLARSGTARARTLVEHAHDSKSGPATVSDVIEGKEELVGLLAAEKSRRRMAEERFAAALTDLEKLRYTLRFCST